MRTHPTDYKFKLDPMCGNVDNLYSVFPIQHRTVCGRGKCGAYPQGLTNANAKTWQDKEFLRRYYPKTSYRYTFKDRAGKVKDIKWIPGSENEVWSPKASEELFRDLEKQGIARSSVARFHFTSLRKEVHDKDGSHNNQLATGQTNCKRDSTGRMVDTRPSCVKASTPLCVARGYYVTNLCTTCCCRPIPGGGRPAALNAKGMQLVMQSVQGECAQWFSAMDTAFSMLAGFVDRYYNSYIWTLPCYGKTEREYPKTPRPYYYMSL